MKAQMTEVSKIETIEQLWIVLGMDNPGEEERTVRDHMMTFLHHLRGSVEGWKERKLPGNGGVKVPPFGDTRAQALILKQGEVLEREMEMHRGYPSVCFFVFCFVFVPIIIHFFYFSLLTLFPPAPRQWKTRPPQMLILWKGFQSQRSPLPSLKKNDSERKNDHRLA